MRISDWSSDVCSSDLEPRSESVLRDVLRGKVQLDTRLQDQSLGDALVIIAFEPTEQITLVAQEQGAFDLEQIGREPFEADRRIGPVRPLPEILAHAGLQVEIGPNCTAVRCLDLSAIEGGAKRAFAFGFEPEAIDVAAANRQIGRASGREGVCQYV